MKVTTLPAVRDVISRLWQERVATPMDLLESLRGTEVAAQNDYAGRVIFEYFQNAVDRAKEKIEITLEVAASGDSARLIFANDGEAVTIAAGAEVPGQAPRSDFHSLCAIFRSDKKPGETIGNKGVGFKSAWEFATRASVCSTLHGEDAAGKGPRWGFRLHQPLDVTALASGDFWRELAAGSPEDRALRDSVGERLQLLGKAPSFLFPEYLGDAESHFAGFEWATTVIVLDGIEGKEKISRLESLITEFRAARLFFVNQLRNRTLGEISVTTRILKDGGSDEKTQSTALDRWTIVTATEETLPGWESRRGELAAAANKINFGIEKPSLALAFPPTPPSGQDAPVQDGLFFCYLPTQVKVPLLGGVHIHADFLLDIARKHIADNDYNNGLLEEAARLLARTVAEDSELHLRDDAAIFLSRRAEGEVEVFTKALEDALFDKRDDTPEPSAIRYLKKAFDPPSLTEARHRHALSFVKSWCYHKHREWGDTTAGRREERLTLISVAKIPLIPLEVAEGKVTERTTFSGKKGESVFLRKGEEKKLAGLDILSNPLFSGIAISTWQGLDAFKDFGIQEFKFDQVIAAIRRVITHSFGTLEAKTEDELGFSPAKLLNLVVALRRDIQNEPARAEAPLQFLESKGRTTTIQELAWLPLPVEGDTWLPAFRVLLPSALSSTDKCPALREAISARGFRVLEQSSLEAALGRGDEAITRVAVEIGAWPCLPLDLQRPDREIKLSFSLQLAVDDFASATVVWSALAKAWPYWAAGHLNNRDRLAGVIEELGAETPWFPLPTLKCCASPRDVVLTKGMPVKAPFLYEYHQEHDFETLLLAELGIRLPEECSPERLQRLLKRMGDYPPSLDQLRGRYRSLMESLSKSGTVPQQPLPLLVLRDRHLVWHGEGGDRPVWFAGRRHLTWRNHFTCDADFLDLRPDVSGEWVKALGVKLFEPVATPDSSGDLQPDTALRSCLATFLPYLILVAENSRTGGTDASEEKVIEKWQRLRFKRGSDVSQRVSFGKKEKLVGVRTGDDVPQKDVVLVTENGKLEIWHDLDDGTRELPLFATALAQGLFRNILLADPFEVCLSRSQAERDDWIIERYGISSEQIKAVRDQIAQQELTPEVVETIVDALQPLLPQVERATIGSSWWDSSLYLENRLHLSHPELLQHLPEAARSVCDLDPTGHNLNRWRAASRRYADRVARGWLCASPSEKAERVQELRKRLLSDDASSLAPTPSLSRYDFDAAAELAEVLREHYGVPIPKGEDLDSWLARMQGDAVGWLRAGQLEKCAAQRIDGIRWALPTGEAQAVVKVGLMTPVTARAEVHVVSQSEEARRSADAGKQLRGETAEVLLALETVSKMLNREVVNEEKRAALWDDLRRNWQKIPFGNSDHANALSPVMPEEAGDLLKELHLSKGMGDGLGFDIISYLEEEDLLAMVEVKDIGNGKIFLSENERRRALQYTALDIPWRLYGFIKGTGWSNLTELILEQARLAGEQMEAKDLCLRPKEWVVEIKTVSISDTPGA